MFVFIKREIGILNFKVFILILFTIFLFCACENSQTYDRFGISFKYPKDQTITVKGVPLYGNEASNESGSILIKSDPKTKPVTTISWLPERQENYKTIAKMMGAFIRAAKLNHEVYLEKTMRESKLKNHKLLLQRYCTSGREGFLLHVIAGWYCGETNRIFQINVSAPWEKPTIIVRGTRVADKMPDWPDLEKDKSYLTLKKITRTFSCHHITK